MKKNHIICFFTACITIINIVLLRIIHIVKISKINELSMLQLNNSDTDYQRYLFWTQNIKIVELLIVVSTIILIIGTIMMVIKMKKTKPRVIHRGINNE